MQLLITKFSLTSSIQIFSSAPLIYFIPLRREAKYHIYTKLKGGKIAVLRILIITFLVDEKTKYSELISNKHDSNQVFS
jgi:hypothetical protein